MMICVGLDLSLTATGVAMDDGDMTTITSKPDLSSVESRTHRLTHLVSRITQMAAHADLAVIEGPSYGQRSQAGEHMRAGLWWLVAAELCKAGIPIVEVPPKSLKKFSVGKGNATKADMRMALYQRTGVDCRDDNQVDAWWLRQVGLHLTGSDERLTLPKTHTDALAAIDTEGLLWAS